MASSTLVPRRQVLGVRLVAIAAVAPTAGLTWPAGGALLLTFGLSCLLLLLVRGGHVARSLLAADAAAGALLLAAAPPDLPLTLVALCTPLLAGLAVGRRAAALWTAAQAVAVAAVTPGLTLPLLWVLAGAAGAAVREHLVRVEALAARSERDRLARETHDSVSKTLHGLALAAEALSRTTDPDTMRRHADLIADAARTAAAETRQVLTHLRQDPAAPAVSLASALRTPHIPGLRVTGALPLLPPPVAREVLAVAAEALENARRHAGATRIGVEAAVTDATLHLVVEDDGRGLPDGTDLPALRAAGHFGLLGMTERATAIGARLHIGARTTGPGTRVRLTLPLGKGA